MKHLFFRLIAVFAALALLCLPSAFADTSHARIVRLSLVQGDVRYVADFHEDSLSDSHASWQAAPLNLPMRQGYALATDNGRAEVEFESGAMLFLGANTVVEFYDLSLHDGSRVTRMVLRQGSVTAYVNPSSDDYFSLTGGDFTVEAVSRTTFRLDNYDDGSNVNVEQGRVNVLRDKQTTPLEKGQSLAVHASDSSNVVIGRLPDTDDFDRWVSGRIDSVVTATNYSQQYVNSPDYTSGFGDLYTYGSWFSFGGYGYCWRPFGVGFGWSPFAFGNWYNDPFFGWSFIGSAPWGWLPYHYGGWVFSPAYGWVWAPSGFGGGGSGWRPIPYRPATAVWVRNGTTIGVVPLHPNDHYGKTALNMSQGIFPVQTAHLGTTAVPAGAEKWSVLREVPRDAVAANVAPTSAPTRVSRTILAGSSGNRTVTLSRDSSIIYDPHEHRFVNSNSLPQRAAAEERADLDRGVGQTNTGVTVAGSAATPRAPNNPEVPSAASHPRVPVTPAPARPGVVFGGSSGGSRWGGGSSSGGSSHAAGPSSSGAHPSGGGGGGGHPR
jgi:hypothetical protein